MPPARKSNRSTSSKSSASGRSTSRRSSASSRKSFKEPTAVNRLNRSLEAAQKAINDLRKQGGRDTGAATRSLQQDLRKFVTDAKRHSGKLSTALKRDFEQAQKTLAGGQSSGSGRRTSSGRRSTSSGRRSTSSGRSTRSGTRRSSTRKAS
jgi:hypothetical protein